MNAASTNSPALALVIDHAIREAHQFRHEYIGCEHLLLGVATLSEHIGADLLMRHRLDFRLLHRHASKLLVVGPDCMYVKTDELPLTRRAQSAVDYAKSLASSQNEILEADHLFLGIIHDPQSAAIEILSSAGITSKELIELSRHYGAG